MESTRNYLDPRALAELQGLSLRARHVVDGYLSGAHRSAHHGYSAEFSQHRPYAPGDDLRNVDWKAFGRTDRLYVKQFVDETNLGCSFLVDASASMSYCGPRSPLSKFAYASCLVAAICWLLRNQGDAVGLSVFGDSLGETLSPQASDEQIGRIIHTLDAVEFSADTSFRTVCRQWSNRFPGRQLVALVSDLFDDLDSVISAIVNLKRQGHEILVFQISDRDEIEFPFDQWSRFEDPEGGPDLVLDPQVYRAGYQRRFREFIEAVRVQCQRECIDFVQIISDQELGSALSAFLVSRGRHHFPGFS